MSLWYSFHITMYFNILFSGCCLYIYIYTTYVCHTYHALGKSWHSFSDTRVVFGGSAISRNGYHGTGRWQCTPCTLWICGAHPAEASLGKEIHQQNQLDPDESLASKPFFFLGVARSWLFIPRIFFTRRRWWKESFTAEVMIYPFGALEHEAWCEFLIGFLWQQFNSMCFLIF